MNRKILAGKRSVLIKINNFILIILLASLLLLLPKILASNLTNLNSEENSGLILLKLEYKNNSLYDIDNDGIETLEGVIDFTVENTIFDLNVNESNLCTRWNIYSIENETSVTVCYGSEKCCNFIELEPSRARWDEVFYSYYRRYGATANNKISAQVAYVDYSLNPENPYSNIHYSSWSSLSAVFKKETKLYTKIINFVNDRLSIVRGAVMKITAVLSYVNDSPIQHESISLYLNNSLVDTKTTDIFGNVAFEFNTTILSPHDYIFNISFPGKTIQSPQETIKIMPSFNLSLVEILPTENENLDVAENLIQLSAEIGRPVEWVNLIEIKNTENETRELNISFKVPEDATNIIVEKNGLKIKETAERTEFSKSSFGANIILTEPCFELKEIKNKEKLFEINDEITQTEIEYRIEYETEAPEKEEIVFNKKNKIKQILVYSNVSLHYYNVSAFTEMPEGIINPRLYHIINNTRIDVTDKKEYDVKFLDIDNNGLNDRIEWIVPQLSEQLFEIGLATINTKKSIYHPGETAEIIMVVLDKNGYLVSDAYVSLEVSNPDNQKEYYSTSSETITETEKGIYEASYFDTGLEGNYSMIVTAIGDNINDTMTSYFTVKDYYEFDILRNTPATTDPWHDVFTSEIRIVSFTNSTNFDFSEVLPSDFNITYNNGAAVTQENNKNVLAWTNLTNNSVVSYSAKLPFATPELYEIGPSYISYGSQTFNEARPWYLAVDPVNTYYGVNSSSYSNYCYDNTIGLSSSTQSDDGTYYQMGRLRSNTATLDWSTADKAFLDIHVQGETVLMTQININWDGYCTVSKGTPTSLRIVWYDWDSETYTNFDDDNFVCGGAEPATNPSVSIGSSYIDDALNGSQYLRVAFAGYGGNKACNDGTDVYHDQVYITVTTLDDLAPQWYNNKSNIVQIYSPTEKSYFNISWNDTVGVSTVWLESNYSGSKDNYSMTRLSGDANSGLYNYSAILPAGTYYWKSYANDTKNQWNMSNESIFTIARASPGITLTLNGSQDNVSMDEDNYIWINGTKTSSDSQNLKLYRNGTLINNNPSPISNNTLFDEPGYYNITLIYEQNTNYSYESKTYFINVSDATAPNVTLLTPENNSYTKNVNVSFYYNVSDYSDIANCTINISTSQEKYVNQSPVDKSETNNFTINNVEQTTVYWFVECTDLSSGKLTGQSETRTLKVDATSPTLSYITPPTPKNNSFKNTSTIVINISHTDNNPANPDTIQLLINGTVNQTNGYEGGDSKFTNFTVILGDGTYNFNVFINDSAGNNNTLANSTVTVDTINPFINYDETNPANNTNQTQNSFIVNVTHTEKNPGTIILYINDTVNQTNPYSGSYTNFSLTNLNDGVYSYYVWLNDSAGNTNKTNLRIISIDSTPPSLFLESPENDTWSTNSNVVFGYNVTDNLMGVDNCSLIINNKLNETNYTITEGVSQNFTISLENSLGYDWSINCSDKLNKINDSETRIIKVDTTFPTISNEGINDTNFTVNQYICLNVSVTDTFSHVKNVTVTIDFPDNGLGNFTFSNESGGCGNAGGDVWSKEVRLTKQGEYNWTKTYAEDYAGNINETMPSELKNWSAVSRVFLNVTMKEPLIDIELNESTSLVNNSYLQVCNVTCRKDSMEDCEDIVLYAQYYDNGWKKITTGTTKLINNLDNRSCGTLNTTEYCNQTFNITIGTTAGWNTFEIKCYAESSNAGAWDSDAVNLTVNDFPVATFTYPQNSSYLNGIKILNGSASTDDQNISNYIFGLDNNTNFDSPTILCDSTDANCTFNTTNQIQCSENSFDCYLRLNVTDSDGLKNSTYITIQIDNTNPFVNLDEPMDNSWDNDGSIDFKYSPYDINIDSCVLYHNDSSWKANETNNNQANGVQDTFAISLDDGNYVWNVLCNDSAGNSAFNATNYTINVDTIFPQIEFADDTKENNTYFNRNWVYVNVSIADENKNETIFYLYNSTLDLISNISRTDGITYVNFTGLSDTNEIYYYNATHTDKAGNSNSTETRKITLDSTYPLIDFADNSEDNDTYFNRDWIYVNVSIIDDNKNETIFYLYNSSLGLVDNINHTDGTSYVNFTGLTDINEIYYYNVTHIDKVGFENSTETRKITLDDTNPVVYLNEPLDDTLTINNNIAFNYTPSDTNLKNCSLYGNFSGTWQLNQTDASPTNGTKNSFNSITISDGNYVWNVKCYDKAGNSAFNSTNYSLEIDASPLTQFSLISPANNTYSTNRTPLLNWTEPLESNFDNYTIIFDDNLNFNSINHNYTVVGNVSNTTYQITPANQLDDNTLFYWKVLAYDTLGNNRNSTEVFIYATDNIFPKIYLESPDNNTPITDSFTVTFYYNTSDNFNVNNCSLIINDNIKDTDTTVDMNTSQSLSYTFTNGQYNWSINCTDKAGNENQSEIRNISINVEIPKVRYYETATGTVSETSVQYINLSTSNEANADRVTINPGPGSTGLFTFDIATFGDNNQVGPNGLLIPASTSITFNGSFQCGTANAGYARWKLEYNNGSGYTEICTAQTSSYVPQTETNMNTSCTSPDYQIYLDTDDALRLSVYFNKTDSKNFGFYHDWDQPDNSGFGIYAYKLGNMVVNLSSPTGTYTVNESNSFNATCNVSCSNGWCYNTKVYIQQNTSSSSWSNINDVTGNLIYVGGSNPQSIGHINSTQLVNFTLKGNQISKDANIMCIATSDYSNANGTKTINVIVRDHTPPTVELNSPQNDSCDNDGNIVFYYTPNDNYNVSNCSLIINNSINQTNHTISEGIQNNFTLNNLGEANYNWSVNCTDSFDNTNSSEIWVIKIDKTYPIIEFADDTEENDTYFNRNWIYVNVSITEDNKNETIFYLYNSSLDLINNTNYTDGTTHINFTNLNSNMVYYYNATHVDKAGNSNSTETRKITLDSTPPSTILNYPINNYNTSANLINFNWTATDNFAANNITCNLTLDGTVNESNVSSSNGAPTNYTISGLADNAHTWNITCWDLANNTNTSETRNFTVVEGPENLTAELAGDNVSIILNWSAKAYSDSYSIYAKEDYTDAFALIDSEITDLNWTDTNAGSYTTRFYKVTTVRGDANATSAITAGKQDVSLTYEDEAATDWNLLSIPFKLTNWELNNGTNNGYDFSVHPSNCIKSLWKYNISTGWNRTDYENGHWVPATGSESFTSLECAKGYWFEINKSCTLTYVGIVPTDNMDIGLGQGWNVVGWYSTNSSTLPIGGSSAYPIIVNPVDSVGAIDKYNPTTDKFEVTIYWSPNTWAPSGNNQDFTTLDPSVGYYFGVNQIATWQHDPNT